MLPCWNCALKSLKSKLTFLCLPFLSLRTFCKNIKADILKTLFFFSLSQRKSISLKWPHVFCWLSEFCENQIWEEQLSNWLKLFVIINSLQKMINILYISFLAHAISLISFLEKLSHYIHNWLVIRTKPVLWSCLLSLLLKAVVYFIKKTLY